MRNMTQLPHALVSAVTILLCHVALPQDNVTVFIDSLPCPVVGSPMTPVVVSTSGLVHDGQHLWTHDDSGGGPVLYRLGETTDRGRRSVRLKGKASVDWEDAAVAGAHVYIGDIGNAGQLQKDSSLLLRESLYIRRIPLSDLTRRSVRPTFWSAPMARLTYWATRKRAKASNVETLKFTYPGVYPIGKGLEEGTASEWDCEAMTVVGNRIHLFTKAPRLPAKIFEHDTITAATPDPCKLKQGVWTNPDTKSVNGRIVVPMNDSIVYAMRNIPYGNGYVLMPLNDTLFRYEPHRTPGPYLLSRLGQTVRDSLDHGEALVYDVGTARVQSANQVELAKRMERALSTPNMHKTAVYSLPTAKWNVKEMITADEEGSFTTIGPITGAAYRANLDKLVLVGNMQDSYQPFLVVIHNYSSSEHRSSPQTILLNMPCAQVEAVCFESDDILVLSNENEKGKAHKVGSCQELSIPKLWRVKLP